ncbi:MAG: hypothetical protein COZ06_18910 [Armatimonadetes bacterium CG_4_10_14_3_um_filter_66_18]|nr:hypothetical protein [Armatimonadota bacterium]OIO99364.1 MAG: hypothetical protein AUJ96_19565 [Armatimonadetes bacterium CG2_30_66_41]PIU94786.1 MAG: hypothetical protein COS65_05900 [Armatimonadetes bacterium CG06_land_8_20_14_3_00_66_21]PIX38674.1 MAG: hypothetical protein COZ57_30120 [Armatimonadetes bacterium CG_4_8_14_3_um_filter_66_20]PIY46077.1 MAG: hypothetical protein COZ06_18910 [Armatimonadetes bacterium CG_4_10_14_3_um_filter_66_18]PIZ48401.1 MAG: hypothetical protein COY42_06
MAWHDEDMQLAAKYGIIQTTGDTVGPGGLSAALRIVPLYVEIAEAMDRLCPDAILLNHSNPMVPICRAINKYTGVCVLGLCHGAQGTEQYVAEVLGIPREELSFRSVGVNHMLWMTDIRHRGRDVYPLLRGKLDERGDEEGHLLARKLFDLYGYYPVNNDRHIIEFFPFLRQARAPGGLPYKLQFRSEMLAERKGKAPQEWEERRKRAAGEAEINLPKTPSPENVGALIGALATGAECKHLVNIPNNGAAPNMPDWRSWRSTLCSPPTARVASTWGRSRRTYSPGRSPRSTSRNSSWTRRSRATAPWRCRRWSTTRRLSPSRKPRDCWPTCWRRGGRSCRGSSRGN